jgi:hypothetical protein
MSEWSQKLPRKPGLYLWVNLWSCPCYCWQRVGLVEISDDEYGCCDATYKANGKTMRAAFYGQRPHLHEGVWHVNAILEVPLPPPQFFSERSKAKTKDGASHTLTMEDHQGYPMGYTSQLCNKCGGSVELRMPPHLNLDGEACDGAWPVVVERAHYYHREGCSLIRKPTDA